MPDAVLEPPFTPVANSLSKPSDRCRSPCRLFLFQRRILLREDSQSLFRLNIKYRLSFLGQEFELGSRSIMKLDKSKIIAIKIFKREFNYDH